MTESLPFQLTVVLFIGLASAPNLAAAGDVSFSRDVLPILSDRCFHCHGPDDEDREADLRLDDERAARKDRGGYAAIVANDVESSAIWQRITSTDPDEVMPPADSNRKPLTARERAIIRQWIQQGAGWDGHWGFAAPVRPQLPTGYHEDHPIDAFVKASLAEHNLQPSPLAPEELWLRRLSLDLIGLPPTLEEIDAFVADDSADARDNAIQRLLSSKHFGERWARWWLDAARYADSNGYEKDSVRYVWPYRDWVISAFNNNVPYDQFVIKQVAGDLLPGASLDDKVATGFLRNSMVNEEGAIKYEQFRVEGVFDRMDALGKSILGLTMQCAQCHTHKYDPIRHDEYYGMFAYLNNMHESTVAYYSPGQRDEIAAINEELNQVRADIRHAVPAWQNEIRDWVRQRLEDFETEPSWTVVTPDVIGDGGQKFYKREDGSLITMGYSPAKSTEKFAGQVALSEVNSLRLELLSDPYLVFGGPGRSLEGTAAISELKLFAGTDPGSLKQLKLEAAVADLDEPVRDIDGNRYPLKNGTPESDRTEGPAAFATDGNLKTAWATETTITETNQPRVLVVNLAEPLTNSNPGQPIHLRFEIACQHGGWNSNDNHHRNLGRFRFAFSRERYPDHRPETPRIRDIMKKAPQDRTPKDQELLFDAWVAADPQLADRANAMRTIRQRHPRPTPQLVARERDGPRRVTRLFHRGEQHHPRHEVQPHVPEFLHDLPDGRDPTSRLTFARWLVDRNSPTAARTLVNRTWQAIFGIGIVESVEDFGHQAMRPSHPELLDWLAVEFMDSGWDFKHLLKLIVSSETYAQDSRMRPELLDADPRNRLLARGSRFRPHAEVVRDIQLAASGLLNRDIGGDSVRPPIPDFLFNPPVSYGYKVWNEDRSPTKRYRRALYTFRFRTVPPPFLSAFDAPTGEVSCVRRPRSTTPSQALATLNEPLSMEAAIALGNVIRDDRSGLDSALTNAFRRCTCRVPTTDELAVLKQLFEKEKSTGEVDPYTAVGRVLLNLDETLTKS